MGNESLDNALGAYLMGVKQEQVLTTARRESGALVVINAAGQKFVYGPETVREAAESQRRGGKSKSGAFETTEVKESREAAAARAIAKRKKDGRPTTNDPSLPFRASS